MTLKTRETRARRAAARNGYELRKSRARNWSADDQLGFTLIDPYNNRIVSGESFSLSLENVERVLGLYEDEKHPAAAATANNESDRRRKPASTKKPHTA